MPRQNPAPRPHRLEVPERQQPSSERQHHPFSNLLPQTCHLTITPGRQIIQLRHLPSLPLLTRSKKPRRPKHPRSIKDARILALQRWWYSYKVPRAQQVCGCLLIAEHGFPRLGDSEVLVHPEGGDGGGVETETLVEAGGERGTGMQEAGYVEVETWGLGDGEGAWGLGGKGEGGEFGVEGGEEGGGGEDAGEEPGEGGELVECAGGVSFMFLGRGGRGEGELTTR